MVGFVTVPPGAFVFWWVALLFVHTVAAAFFGFFAYFYWRILGSKYNYLAKCLDTSNIGMKPNAFPTVALFLGLAALPHGLTIVQMLAASLFYRSLAYLIEPRDLKSSICRLRGLNVDPGSPTVKLTSKAPTLLDRARSLAAKAGLPVWLRPLFQRMEAFGTGGKYFFFVLLCRETFEMSLQTNQAYRATLYLPRVALVQFFVTLIVLNCWSTPLILHLYKRDEAKKRFICLVCDGVLDLVAGVVIPCTIIGTYVSDFDMTLYEFPMSLWYENIWYMHASQEFQIVFVTSWSDLATRMAFSIGKFFAMSGMKSLLGARHSHLVRRNQGAAMGLANPDAKVPVQKQPPPDTKIAVASTPPVGMIRWAASSRFAISRFASMRLISVRNRLHTASRALKDPRYQRNFTRFVHIFVVLWGVVVLGLHLHAESIPVLPQCLL